jgi:hypothetical protein
MGKLEIAVYADNRAEDAVCGSRALAVRRAAQSSGAGGDAFS